VLLVLKAEGVVTASYSVVFVPAFVGCAAVSVVLVILFVYVFCELRSRL
jgi:hypothetical protein